MATTVTDRLFGENSSVAIKAPVIAVAPAPIALSGLQSIGGYMTQSGDRVLVTGQADPTTNGIYNASTAAWTRTGDCDGNNDLVNGTLVIAVLANGGVLFYQLVAANPVTIGGSPLIFTPFYIGAQVNYPIAPAEVLALAVVVNPAQPVGVPDRYAINVVPGTTDMTGALTTANAVWANGGPAIALLNEAYAVASNLTLAAPLIFTGGSLLKPAQGKVLTLNGSVTGPLTQLFSVTRSGAVVGALTITGGAGYANGTYTNVPFTGGSGAGATGTVVIAGGVVVGVSLSTNGSGYLAADTLSAAAASIGGIGAGFSFTPMCTQILGSLGSVDLYPQWWGAKADGNFAVGVVGAGLGTPNGVPVQNCLNTAMGRSGSQAAAPNLVRFTAGIWYLDTQIRYTNGMTLKGSGYLNTVLFAAANFATTSGLIAAFNAAAQGNPSLATDFCVTLQANAVTAGLQGIVSTQNGAQFQNLWLNGFGTAGGVGLNIVQTDNQVANCFAELNQVGFLLQQSDTTLSNCRTYQNQVYGVEVSNAAAAANGEVLINGLRSTDDGQSAVLVLASKNVTLKGVSATSTNNAKFSVAGININGSSDVTIEAPACTLAAGASVAPGILINNACSRIAVSGARVRGFYDGLQASGCTGLTVGNGMFTGNSRRGLYLASGSEITAIGNLCVSNTENGIHSDNSAGSGWHNLVGNGCHLNGGVGLLANIGNGTAFSNVQGNQARGNTGANISYTGTTANINEGVAPTNF